MTQHIYALTSQRWVCASLDPTFPWSPREPACQLSRWLGFDFRLGAVRCLSYREQDVLGRPLKPDETAYVSEMVRRIAAILLMGPRS